MAPCGSLNLADHNSDCSDGESTQISLGDGTKSKNRSKRSRTNARPEYVVREVLACLLSGRGYSEYVTESIVRNMPNSISHSTFDRYV